MENKTLILSSINNSTEKAVLNVEKNEEGYYGTIRLYNFKDVPKGILTLGFLINKEVFKAGLNEVKKNLFEFELKTQKNLSSFTCALVNVKDAIAIPLLCGSTEAKTIDLSFAKNFNLLDETSLTIENVENQLNESEIYFDKVEQEEIEKEIDNNLATKCSNCNYRKAFYCSNSKCECETEQMSLLSTYPEEQSFSKVSSQTNFYDEIKGQLSLLFERYPEETFLTEIIPNSKWVKVDYEDNGQYFVIGLLYENEKVEYVCYGMPGEFSTKPPRELGDLSQWLPLDPEKPNELGYWIMYQDAETGENVEIKIS